MRIVTGYKGEAHITSNDDQGRNQGIFGPDRYVLWVGNKMATTASGTNAVQIADGEAIMKGVHFRIEPGVAETVSVTAAASGKYRADLIVARYTKNGTSGVESITLMDIKGTEVSSQGAVEVPSYEDGDILEDGATCDMVMAKLIVSNAGIISIDPLVGSGAGGYTILQGIDELLAAIGVLQYADETMEETVADLRSEIASDITQIQNQLTQETFAITLKNITGVSQSSSCNLYGSGAGTWTLAMNIQGVVAGTTETAIGTLPDGVRPIQNFFRIGMTQNGYKYILIIRTNGNIGIQMLDQIDTAVVGNLTATWYRETVAFFG